MSFHSNNAPSLFAVWVHLNIHGIYVYSSSSLNTHSLKKSTNPNQLHTESNIICSKEVLKLVQCFKDSFSFITYLSILC